MFKNLKKSLEDSYDLCKNNPFTAYDKAEFDYFYHLIEKAERIVDNGQITYSSEEEEFINWYQEFKTNNNF